MIRPADEATAKLLIAAAPASVLPVMAATSRADCSNPHGQATHRLPPAAARTGPRKRCHAPVVLSLIHI